MEKIIQGLLIDEESYSYFELCEKYDVSEEVLNEMLEYGLFTLEKKNLQEQRFDQKTVVRIQSARRLQQDLDINLPGVVLALELLDELESLKQEIRVLRGHLR